MQTNQPNRAKRFRIIVFATIIAFIVVIFGAWIITSAIKSAEKSRQQEITATEESKEEKTNKTETKAENKTEAKTEAKSSEKTNNQGQILPMVLLRPLLTSQVLVQKISSSPLFLLV